MQTASHRSARRTAPAALLVALVVLSGLTAAGCSASRGGAFVWVDEVPLGELPAPSSSQNYVFRPGDVLQVRVFGQDGMSARTRIRPDGNITLPFLNDVQAAGYTPTELGRQIQDRLRKFVNEPVVTVSLEETQALQVPVIGEVERPGTYVVREGSGVLELLAQAGSLTEFARRDGIYVHRRNEAGELVRIRFKYDDLVRGRGNADRFRLQSGDVMVVE